MERTFGENADTKSRLMRLVLETSDGIGRGAWASNPRYIKCPLTKPVKYLLETFFPLRQYRDPDAAIKLFGFKRDYDFFYAALAYNDLQKRNPKGCSRLATVFQKRYDEGNLLRVHYWTSERDGILPKLDNN